MGVDQESLLALRLHGRLTGLGCCCCCFCCCSFCCQVSFVSEAQLHSHLSSKELPACLGGTQGPFHSEWLQVCMRVFYERRNRRLYSEKCRVQQATKFIESPSLCKRVPVRVSDVDMIDGLDGYKSPSKTEAQSLLAEQGDNVRETDKEQGDSVS